ncbi:SurA N-terminal domain-containing protein [Desulfobacter latus]|uniref:SurA N-terminal domain-containing protein n=1 Tax=Desulfobacter latus TaxID=2292 RepID=A0A850SWN3_9BACT|nr:SurA N-terminal domain-containing protein [Desulfobacter latus]NWH05734.1 SurA N-terminal domain-containing protein [Desulfobacter latus]
MSSIVNSWYGIKDVNGFSRGFSSTLAFGTLLLMAAGIAIVCVPGCTDQKKVEEKGHIIKAGTVEISRADFVWELEIKQANYPYDIKNRPNEYNAMVLDLVSDLSDEAVLLAAAAAKGIDVSANELDAAIADFKKDYPEDSFDQMLLERAILYPVWKKRLKKDLVIRKLIMQDLVASQELHPGDMIAFYDRVAGKSESRDNNNLKMMDEKKLLLKLRMEKSREALGEWLQALQAGYPVHINRGALSTFLINAEK